MKYLLILTLLLVPTFASANNTAQYEDAYRLLYIIQLEKRYCVFQNFISSNFLYDTVEKCLQRSLTRRQTKNVYIRPGSVHTWNDGRVFGGVLLTAEGYESERTRLYGVLIAHTRRLR